MLGHVAAQDVEVRLVGEARWDPIEGEMEVGEFSRIAAEIFEREGVISSLCSADGRNLVDRLEDGRTRWRIGDSELNMKAWICGTLIEWQEALKLAPEGLALEFGVRNGITINELAKLGRQIYGFDWWKGLPHSDNHWVKGSCATTRPVVPQNVTLVEGLFSDSLEFFLESHCDPVAFVNCDCDLYSPTLYILHSLVDRFVSGSIVAFSAMTFGDHQRRAWDRYLKETGQNWELIGKQHWAGEIYKLQAV
jgi:hypothetical protein